MISTAPQPRTLNVLPRQHDFLADDYSDELMFSGAVGAGKTRVLCIRRVVRASVPGARELLCRKTLSALKGTTLKTLLEGDGDMPPVLPPGTYTHNKADKCIKIHGGGEILYFPLVNDGDGGTQQRAGSYNGTGVGIDEATELDEGDYRMLLSRARVQVKGVRCAIDMVCNPSTPSHFLAKRFAPPGSGYMAPMKGCRCISSPTHENFFLPKSYIESLDRDKESLWYRRFVLGLWCGAEGLVYDKWDRNVHVHERSLSEFRSFVVGVDDGFTNPFVALLIGIDADGRAHVCNEVYQSGLDVGSRVASIGRLASGLPSHASTLDSVLIDPSAPDVIAAVGSGGYPGIAANNDVLPGINAVTSRLLVAGDGKPRLTVDPSCVELIREMETYQWKKDKPKDEPVKKFDHGCDALRYAVMQLDGGQRFIAEVMSGRVENDPIEMLVNKPIGTQFAQLRAADPDFGFDN
jgi:hypothetical protein